jgi:hypothetical protein
VNGPPTSLRDQILQATAARPSVTRKTHRQRRLVLVLLLLAFVVGSSAMLVGRHTDVPDRPMTYLSTMLGASVFIAILTAYVTLGPTESALGRSPRFYRVLTILTPCLLAVAAIVANVLVPSTMVEDAGHAAPHVSCSAITFFTGAGVLLLLLWLERRSMTNSAAAKGASFGAVAAAWATLFISISCPYSHPWHVVPTHVFVPVIPLLVGGIVGGARLLVIRAETMNRNAQTRTK